MVICGYGEGSRLTGGGNAKRGGYEIGMVHMGITSAYEAGSVLGMRPQLREFSTSENSEFATHDYVEITLLVFGAVPAAVLTSEAPKLINKSIGLRISVRE